MCILCVEFQKETLSAPQLKKLTEEILFSGDIKHLENLIQIADNISEEYDNRLGDELNEAQYDENKFNDPFDAF